MAAVTTKLPASDVTTVDKPAQQADRSKLVQALTKAVEHAIELLGNSKESLCAPWIGRLCVFNALVHALHMLGQRQERQSFPAKHGQQKVASFAVMNGKYVGAFYAALTLHIIGGTLSVLGSAASIALEERRQALSKKLALLASAAETFLHAPSAMFMSPIVYGDKGVTPFVYMMTSMLLQLSGLSALFESTSEELPGPKGCVHRRPELRRMSSTVGIFLYVRLYGQMRGINNFLEPQKYTVATLLAGFAMMPIGWDRFIYPLTFWAMFAWNFKTVNQTNGLVRLHGIDGAAAMQMKRLGGSRHA